MEKTRISKQERPGLTTAVTSNNQLSASSSWQSLLQWGQSHGWEGWAVSNKVAEKSLAWAVYIAFCALFFCLSHCSGLECTGLGRRFHWLPEIPMNYPDLLLVIFWKSCLVSPYYFPLLSKWSLHWEITIELMCSSNGLGPPLAIYFPEASGEEGKDFEVLLPGGLIQSSLLILSFFVLDAQSAGSEGSYLV